MKYGGENPNRLALYKKLNLNPEKVYGLNQIHSQIVLVVDSNNPPSVEADGMISNDKNITLSVTVADCLPVYLIDNVSGAFGLVHSGWKGTGIVCNALNLMKQHYSTNPQDVTAILGPCIGVCCYKVDAERAAVFENNYGARSVKKDKDSFYLDLKEANKYILTQAGVINIMASEDCTCCDKRFGSFRREGEAYTRMTALLSFPSNLK
jgi:YfiH family protein